MTLTPCLESFCGRVAAPKGRGRCEVHAAERNRETHRTGRLEPSSGRIYGKKRWTLLRRRRLFMEPLCRTCGVVADTVDHVIPVEHGGDPWAIGNTRSLCRSCHSSRHARERVGNP